MDVQTEIIIVCLIINLKCLHSFNVLSIKGFKRNPYSLNVKQ